MILLCGIPSEPPLQMVREAAERLGIAVVLFNQRQAVSTGLRLHFQPASPGFRPGQGEPGFHLSGELVSSGVTYSLDAIQGVFVRLMDFQSLPEYKSSTSQQEYISRLHGTLNDWLEIAPIRIMNRLSAMGSNSSKPYQSQLIAALGFRIPPTLVTNDPGEARRFMELHERVIYKSASSIRSIVQELGQGRMPDSLTRPQPPPELEKIRYLPTQFQALIPGDNIRVHVAGERLFATSIRSTAVDYRYPGGEEDDFEMQAIELEPELTARCLALSRQLGLPLCGIDLKRTPEGEIYCFEVNPSPAFSYYQGYTGQPVAEAIVEYLSNQPSP